MTRHFQDQGAASDWSYHVISVEFLRSFLIRHFDAKLMVALRNVGYFSACTIRIVNIHVLVLSYISIVMIRRICFTIKIFYNHFLLSYYFYF